jgi:MinD superfamily P-loop ATPase
MPRTKAHIIAERRKAEYVLEQSKWMSQAKCRQQSKSTSLFFEYFERATPAARREIAKFCESCEVCSDCYEHAINASETGLWGGVYFLVGKPKNSTAVRYLEDSRDMAATK